MKEGISGIEGKTDNMYSSVKENVKKKKIVLAQNIQETWDTMKKIKSMNNRNREKRSNPQGGNK